VSGSRCGAFPPRPIELWGGVECTVNRVGERSFDQMKRSGHSSRASDLDLIAGLGIRTLRYPVLWELTAPDYGVPIDWTWADDRLLRMAALGIRPIIGLVHHGSGPRYTSLTDPGFATGLARYAEQVARRFPWVQMYTPVNEPLTTARFSGLYGLWYPHGRDNATFARALINQCRGTALAMQAIRRVNSGAQLVQTDDLGRTRGTPRMQYQVDFDNERRWIAWDLLCGRVSRHHPLYRFLIDSGIDAAELAYFLDNPGAPDIIGINHYVTSDRYLDERCDRYPAQCAGSNGCDRYADVEAVRVVPEFQPGWPSLLQQAWQRYRIPLIVSEVHLGCTREEQVRWFHEAWHSTHEARSAGVDVRAVTAWALFGSFNWNSLLTADDGHYEAGAFDVRGPQPRPTALASLLRDLTAGSRSRHPILQSPGWWHRSRSRIFEGEQRPLPCHPEPTMRRGREAPRPIVICGALGVHIQGVVTGACEQRGLAYLGFCGEQLDICDAEAIEQWLERTNPWAVIDAGWVHAAGVADKTTLLDEENEFGIRALAIASALLAIPLLTFSSRTKSKAAADLAIFKHNPRALCVSFSELTSDVVKVGLDLLIDGECGLWHFSPFQTASHRASRLANQPR
jgi:dTDP-4-dehydrorhamnose reductase